ncbi:MAG: SDR family NAD(P)-dependent oxidoreductase [Steroidobacteraceae bacterium]
MPDARALTHNPRRGRGRLSAGGEHEGFRGKVAFITGGASGLGLGLAKVFAEAGCKVVIADIRQDHLDGALQTLRGKSATVHGIRLDITDRKAYAAAADEVEKVFGGPPQLLFNNAGVNTFGPTEKSTYEDWDWLLGVLLGGVVNGMQTFVPRMIAAKRPGYIVNTSSLGGFAGSDGAAIYSAAKAAVNSLSESYAMALKKYDIGVSVCCPANIKSNIAEATYTRPAHLQNTGYVVDAKTIDSLRSIHSHGMEPVELATHIRRGIEAGQLYIIPYPESKPMLEAHFKMILDSVLPLEADPEGAKKRTDALMNWARDRGEIFRRSKDNPAG